MVMKGFELIKFEENHFSYDPPLSPHPEIDFWPALSHFLIDFFEKGIKMLRNTSCFK